MRMVLATIMGEWFALWKLRPTSEDSNQLPPVGLGSSPWLYIQSEALQDIAFPLRGQPLVLAVGYRRDGRGEHLTGELTVGQATPGIGWRRCAHRGRHSLPASRGRRWDAPLPPGRAVVRGCCPEFRRGPCRWRWRRREAGCSLSRRWWPDRRP